jgi:hypothetical protein
MNYINHNDNLDFWMDQKIAPIPEWSEPEQYDLNDTHDRNEMFDRVYIGNAKVHKRIGQIAEDLFEMQHPNKKDNDTARDEFMGPLLEQGNRFGKWFYFPWSNDVVQYADKDIHRQLKSNRNRDLITADEQLLLSNKTLVYAGLSVGSNAIDEASHLTMGGHMILADPDRISVPNTNRIHVGMPQVGMRKTDAAGIKLSELDPYVRQTHFPDGVTHANAGKILALQPDIIFEHADHMPSKLLLRQMAKYGRAALIMATDVGDRSLIDVERYDNAQDSTRPFLGRLDDEQLKKLDAGTMSAQEQKALVVQIVGMSAVSRRLMGSLPNIGRTLGGLPQLGTTASSGAAAATVAAREIILGRGPSTGRYYTSPQGIFNTSDAE